MMKAPKTYTLIKAEGQTEGDSATFVLHNVLLYLCPYNCKIKIS